jgi:predicted phosphodiesterase
MIYITGDTHAEFKRFSKKVFDATENDYVIICGDFGGVWDESSYQKYWLDWLGAKPWTTLFVDGNHENYDLLASYPVSQWHGGKVHYIRPNVIHLMRGQVFTIDGLKIFTMGGGESPDLEYRLEETSWYKYEIPSKAELLEGANNLENVDCKVNVIITHEPSSIIKDFLKLGNNEPIHVTTLNAYFDELSKCSTFNRWFFGSLHLDKYISNSYIGVHKALVNAHTGERVSI